MVACWRWTGVNIMYYMAGLQNISEEIYESVDIDGGNAWQKFRYITVPLLKPTTIYVLTISIYGSMAMFIESYMLYEGNKSIANNGLTIVGYLYRKGLQQNNLGYGAAVGVFLLLVVFIVNMAQLNLFGMFRKEEGSK
jgi:arabinosaccharide transport system permease protein